MRGKKETMGIKRLINREEKVIVNNGLAFEFSNKILHTLSEL